MENNTIEKIIDVTGNMAKAAANLSEIKKEPKPRPISQTDDNSNKASTGSQNVQIHMDSGKRKDPKPVEKHVHVFPENRALTTEECELDLKKAEMEYNLKTKEEEYFQKCCDRDWQHRLEVEKKDEKKGKIRRVIGGILVAIGAGCIGYGIYADYRDNKNKSMAPKALPETSAVAVDGEVK